MGILHTTQKRIELKKILVHRDMSIPSAVGLTRRRTDACQEDDYVEAPSEPHWRPERA